MMNDSPIRAILLPLWLGLVIIALGIGIVLALYISPGTMAAIIFGGFASLYVYDVIVRPFFAELWREE